VVFVWFGKHKFSKAKGITFRCSSQKRKLKMYQGDSKKTTEPILVGLFIPLILGHSSDQVFVLPLLQAMAKPKGAHTAPSLILSRPIPFPVSDILFLQGKQSSKSGFRCLSRQHWKSVGFQLQYRPKYIMDTVALLAVSQKLQRQK